MGDLYAWLVSLLFLVSLLVIVVYQLTCLADLENDYVNPYDTSTRINRVVFPEMLLQGVLSFFYLITGHWIMALLSLPYIIYNARLFTQKEHTVDVTEIFTSLNKEKKKRLIKLGHIVVFLLITSFWVIHSALGDD